MRLGNAEYPAQGHKAKERGSWLRSTSCLLSVWPTAMAFFCFMRTATNVMQKRKPREVNVNFFTKINSICIQMIVGAKIYTRHSVCAHDTQDTWCAFSDLALTVTAKAGKHHPISQIRKARFERPMHWEHKTSSWRILVMNPGVSDFKLQAQFFTQLFYLSFNRTGKSIKLS